MTAFQQCQSTIGWQPVPVKSASREGLTYVVHVNPWGNVHEDICECESYMYRGQCHHQDVARSRVCGWHQLIHGEEEPQSKEERRLGKCPRCGGPTIRQVLDE